MSNQNIPANQEEKNYPLSVLLVDDEELVLRSLKRMLHNESYQILLANSGKSALEILEKKPVQLIVSDYRMPVMTGIEFLENVRKLYPDTIRILLTGYSDLKIAEDAINRVEIYRFLTKPWNDEDLKATIRQGLNKWVLEQENLRLIRELEQKNDELIQWNEKLEKLVEERTLALKEAQSQLIQSEKMAALGVLAGGVAHEMNNPLGGILGITQVLLMDRLNDESLVKDLKTIEQAAIHCSEIVKNLLAFSRKGDPQKREPTFIPDLIDKLMHLIGHLFKYNNIQLKKNFSPDFPMLMINPREIQQVLMNLLVNAQQAMGRGGVVSIIGKFNDQLEPIIIVQDQGIGIPQSILPKIFDPFFTTKKEGEGTGLGLSVCYRIMQAHAGRIEVDSKEGKGTSMILVFPKSAIIKKPPDKKDIQLEQILSINQFNN